MPGHHAGITNFGAAFSSPVYFEKYPPRPAEVPSEFEKAAALAPIDSLGTTTAVSAF